MGNEDTVTKGTDSAPQATEKDQGAPADESLDDVLSRLDAEWDQGKKPETKADAPKQEPGANYVTRDEFEQINARLVEEDVTKAASTVKEFMGDTHVSDRVIRGTLMQIASEDKRFGRAFDERFSNPAGWQKALKAAAKQLKEELGTPVDAQATEDRQALAAAVRGSKTATAEDDVPNFAAMTDQEFEEYKRKHG